MTVFGADLLVVPDIHTYPAAVVATSNSFVGCANEGMDTRLQDDPFHRSAS